MQGSCEKDIVKYLMRISNTLEKIERNMRPQPKTIKIHPKDIKGECKGCKAFENCSNKMNMGNEESPLWFPSIDSECNKGE